ncbi:MAG: alpha-L-fucosidase [Candidatus Lokiarchaeota archaeon]|nr:alpha-L-fucosidase [Candidatus Lokiarchaeota archaeon]
MTDLVRPTEAQARWQDDEFGIFVHFGMNTFNNREWSDGTCSLDTFNPTRLDCEQWVTVAKDAGARYMVLVCKHHDGFCLWQTRTTEYCVQNTPWKGGKGDVVAEFVAACRKHGMQFGFYLSPWDRHEPRYEDKEAYDKYYAAQLEELVTGYAKAGEIYELWFDGAGSTGRVYDWPMFMGIVKKHQPDAMIFNMGDLTIRWVGNENGVAPYPTWNVVKAQDAEKFAHEGVKPDGTGDKWIPAECDVPIHHRHWFHHKGAWGVLYHFALFSKKRLVEIYEKSVGHGANLLLNLAPTERGLFSDRDVARLGEMAREIRRRYGTPVAETSGKGSEIVLDLKEPKRVTAVVLQEDIKQGERVRKYTLQAQLGGNWQDLDLEEPGIAIGHKKIDKPLAPLTTGAIKLVVTESVAEPIIQSFKVYSF